MAGEHEKCFVFLKNVCLFSFSRRAAQKKTTVRYGTMSLQSMVSLQYPYTNHDKTV